ncbi:unnamed protein product [Rotaria sp. Silwood2]|nr:unnamed protein product [Rotaria sp. Silwood2]CAF2591267.1 unnamed protein product [Rotaria sp. Silwood2]CAF2831280.1 unnamed protein product [Rotaria sp. Silwood2]CAF2984107.1 unnamed protein product [Rotaria sp. Silwood2]CAF3851425.1 unnamed protein product [Rotaria sp. Silwood2]
MSDRNTEYVLVRNPKPKKTRQYYYDDDPNDDDDDDNDSQIYGRLVSIKPRREQRIKYISNDENDYDYRSRIRDPKIRTRKKTNGNQIIIDDDDSIIKIIRNSRTPSPLPIEHRRLRSRPRESQPIFYEISSDRLASRPLKKNTLRTKKTQVVYADDEPIRVIKKVIIDPRTGDRETIYENDKPKKQQKYYMQQRPAEILIDSDDDDEQQKTQYVKLSKRRTVSTEVLPRREPSPRYIMIKKGVDPEPVYVSTSKMPSIKTNRRVVYEVPAKKSLTTYVYSSDGKYYK